MAVTTSSPPLFAPLPPLPPCRDPQLYMRVLNRSKNCMPRKPDLDSSDLPLKCGYILNTFSCIASVISDERQRNCKEGDILSVINRQKGFINDVFMVNVKNCKFDFLSDFACMNPLLVDSYATLYDLWPLDVLDDGDWSLEQKCAKIQTGFELTFQEIEKNLDVICTKYNVIVSMTLFSPRFYKEYGFRLTDCLGLEDDTGVTSSTYSPTYSPTPSTVTPTPSPITLELNSTPQITRVSRPPTKKPLVVIESAAHDVTTATTVGVVGCLILILLMGIVLGMYFRKKRKRRAHGDGNNPVIHHQHSRNTLENRFHNNMAYNLSLSRDQGLVRRDKRPSGEYCELKVRDNPENVYAEITSTEKPGNYCADLRTEYTVTSENAQPPVLGHCEDPTDVYYLDVSQINTPTNQRKLPVSNNSYL